MAYECSQASGLLPSTSFLRSHSGDWWYFGVDQAGSNHDTSEISKVADRLSFANVIHDYLLWPMKAYVIEAFPRLLYVSVD